MDVRSYVIVVELLGARRPGAPSIDLQIVDGYDMAEACKTVLVETMGRYGCENCQIVFVRPATMHNVNLAVQAVQQLPFVRMTPIGMVA